MYLYADEIDIKLEKLDINTLMRMFEVMRLYLSDGCYVTEFFYVGIAGKIRHSYPEICVATCGFTANGGDTARENQIKHCLTYLLSNALNNKNPYADLFDPKDFHYETIMKEVEEDKKK